MAQGSPAEPAKLAASRDPAKGVKQGPGSAVLEQRCGCSPQPGQCWAPRGGTRLCTAQQRQHSHSRPNCSLPMRFPSLNWERGAAPLPRDSFVSLQSLQEAIDYRRSHQGQRSAPSPALGETETLRSNLLPQRFGSGFLGATSWCSHRE